MLSVCLVHPTGRQRRAALLEQAVQARQDQLVVDLKFSQEVPGFFAGHKGVLSLDVLNFGNLLNRRWGRIEEINFPSTRKFVNFNGITADGKMVYNVVGEPDAFILRQNKGESQWALQVTARYEF